MFLADDMGLQTALLVVGVIAEQKALLALLFAPADKAMAGQGCAVEVDGREGASLGVVVDEDTGVGQVQALESTADVVVVTQGAPALILGDQSVLKVVFELQRWVPAVIDADQSPERVVVVLDPDSVGQGLDP
ncbi:hypothetical protein D9M71_267070 [compost metagenome]